MPHQDATAALARCSPVSGSLCATLFFLLKMRPGSMAAPPCAMPCLTAASTWGRPRYSTLVLAGNTECCSREGWCGAGEVQSATKVACLAWCCGAAWQLATADGQCWTPGTALCRARTGSACWPTHQLMIRAAVQRTPYTAPHGTPAAMQRPHTLEPSWAVSVMPSRSNSVYSTFVTQ
jgi:hypothetical protein